MTCVASWPLLLELRLNVVLGVILKRSKAAVKRPSVAARWQRGTILAVGVLHGDLPASKREQVATLYFHAMTIWPRACKSPLGNSAVALNEVTGAAPVSIRIGCPDLCVGGADGLAAHKAGTTPLGAR